MRTQIPITGLSTTSAYADGECISLVNLRKKNGTLKPVTPRKVINTLSSCYDILFVHNAPNNIKNWIGVKHIGMYSQLSWTSNPNSNWIELVTFQTITAIQQIGNTLSVITENSIKYLLWNDQSYKVLGELPELPVIKLASITRDRSFLERNFLQEYGSLTWRENSAERTLALSNKIIAECTDPVLFDARLLRYAFRLYDGTITKHSPPILIMPKEEIGKLKQIRGVDEGEREGRPYHSYDASFVSVGAYNITIDLSLSGIENWKDIIKSVDIFISKDIGITSLEQLENFGLQINQATLRMDLIDPYGERNIDKIKNTSSFYLIRSIIQGTLPFPESFPNVKEMEVLKNIINQEVMKDDNFSHNKIGAKGSYVYNSRLNIFNLQTTLFSGFKNDYFRWTGEYNGVVSNTQYTIGRIVTEVELNVNGTIRKLYSITDENMNFFNSAFLSYPDARATQMRIYLVDYAGRYDIANARLLIQATLIPHDFLNLSYCLNYELKPYTTMSGGILSPIISLQENNKVIERNKLKVSSLNNPFNFPSINTYLIGNGTILNAASNAMRISEGQYGQYPLYIFTNDAIYALNVGSGEVVYSNISPVSQETPISSVICSTPFGVCFLTKRGLYVINGQQVDFLSLQLEQEPENYNIELSRIVNTVDTPFSQIHNFAQTSFVDYIKEVTDIVFNPHQNELIISNPNKGFNYVLNLDSKEWYQSTEQIDKVVGNVYPELIVTEGEKLKDYGESETNKADVSIITRPLQFGTGDIKNVSRMIMRGTLHSAAVTAIQEASEDAINFKTTRGYQLAEKNYKDIDLGLTARNKHRQFIFGLGATLDEESKITLLDVQVEGEYNNEKMR